MYNELYEFCDEMRVIFRNEPSNFFYWLIGKNIPDKDDNFMNDLLCISGRFINEMYIKQYKVERVSGRPCSICNSSCTVTCM